MMECTLRTLLLRLKAVMCELGLRERASRSTFACRNLGMFQPELRECILNLKVAILEPEPWEATLQVAGQKVTICDPELREC